MLLKNTDVGRLQERLDPARQHYQGPISIFVSWLGLPMCLPIAERAVTPPVNSSSTPLFSPDCDLEAPPLWTLSSHLCLDGFQRSHTRYVPKGTLICLQNSSPTGLSISAADIIVPSVAQPRN